MLIVCSIQTVIWVAAISLNLSLPSCYTPVSCFLLNKKQEQASELVFVTVRWTDSQFCTVASAGTKLLPDLFHPPLPLCSLSSHRSSPPLSIAWCELSPPFKSNLCARFFCVRIFISKSFVKVKLHQEDLWWRGCVWRTMWCVQWLDYVRKQ